MQIKTIFKPLQRPLNLLLSSKLELSIPLLMGKGSWLISGYNTASKEEKEKYNERKLCKAMGIMCAIIGIITLIYTNMKCKKN